MTRTSYILIYVSFLIPTLCIAQPQIDNATIDLEAGEVAVVGQGFGQKDPAAPRLWMDFEDLELGMDPLYQYAYEIIINNDQAQLVVTDSLSWAGNKSLLMKSPGFLQVKIDLGEFTDAGSGTGDREFYLSLNHRVWKNAEPEDTSVQYKTWKLSSDVDAYYLTNENSTGFTLTPFWYQDPDRWVNSPYVVVYDGSGIGGGQSIHTEADFYLWNQWQRMEQFIHGSPDSIGDGYAWMKRIGRHAESDLPNAWDLPSTEYVSWGGGLRTHDENDRPWRYFNLQATWLPSPHDVTTYTHYDNVYVDDTRARVEIGNAPVFQNCTQREIQVPFSWSAGGNYIEASLNIDAIDHEAALWLFVVDAWGNASAGFPLLWDQSSSPGQPSLLRFSQVEE